MFTRVPDASKVALVTLVAQLRRWGFGVIDCQMKTDHLARFGAREISRAAFLRQLDLLVTQAAPPNPWQVEPYGR